MTTIREVAADFTRMNTALHACGAVITYTEPDGSHWQGIDTSKAPPELVSAYTNLSSYAYANGMLQ